MTPRVREILSWYGADNPGVLNNIARILNSGQLAGTGKVVILPVDHGFEFGPSRSFAKNPKSYDPLYHFELAIESGCSAYAAPLGFLEAGAREFAGEVPLILNVNNTESLSQNSENPISSITSSVDDALRLGCVGVGFTIYPGSSEQKQMYEEIAIAAKKAKALGLAGVIWSYPRGTGLSKEGEKAVDIIAYGAQIAAQLGAHIIQVETPDCYIEQKESRTVFEQTGIKIEKLCDRVKHIVDSSFNGRRIILFSGNENNNTEEAVAEVKELAAGGAFGSIMGQKTFQQPMTDAVTHMNKVMNVFAGINNL